MRITGFSVGYHSWECRSMAAPLMGMGYGGMKKNAELPDGNGDGLEGYNDGNGHGEGINSHLYKIYPFTNLTLGGDPEDDTFENFAFHLQVEPLVHRRVR